MCLVSIISFYFHISNILSLSFTWVTGGFQHHPPSIRAPYLVTLEVVDYEAPDEVMVRMFLSIPMVV